MLTHNYHCHTARCMHAEGADEAYVQAAIAGGYQVLGFSDHVPWPFAGGFTSRIRMPIEEMPGYLASVAALKEKYAGQITLHTAFESEFYPRYIDHLRRLREEHVDYLLLGQHFSDSEEDNPGAAAECRTDDGILRYAESVVAALRTGLFAYVAHPDLYMRLRRDDQFNSACERAADMICQAALEMRVPIEYNLLGQLESAGYPSAPFWQYASKWHNPVILGVDAHAPWHLQAWDNIDLGKKRVLDLGYTLIDKLPLDE